MADPAEALASPAPLLSPGTDPLAALAAQLGSQDGLAQPQPGQHEVVPMEEDAAAEPEPVAPAMGPIELSYRSACEARGVEPLPAHLDALLTIPESLLKPLDTRRAPSGTAGGAALAFPAVAAAVPAHVDALLALLTQPSSTGTLPLLDHLNLSGTPVPAEALTAALPRAAALGHWWRLRSLELSGCGLGIEQLRVLCSPEAQAFLWHLQRLDLSGNPEIGTAASPTALAAPDLLLGLRLWRSAPLKYLNLVGTDLSAGALAMCLRAMRVYDAPSTAGGTGTPVHDGARMSLECLKIGPPAGGVWSKALLGELKELVAAAPALAALELHGAGPAERDALADAWTAAQLSHGLEGVQAAVVRDGVVRLSAGAAAAAALPCERPPSGHTLPGPDTPLRDAGEEVPVRRGFLAGLPPHILDDWCDGGGGGDDHPQRMVQDVLRPSVGVGASLPPRQPAPKAAREPRRAGGGGGGGGGGRSRLRTSAADYAGPSYGGDGEPKPRKTRGTGKPRKRRAPAGEGSGAERPARLYRGGAAEDELMMGGVDIILSDDDARAPYYSDDEYDDDSDIDSEEEERYHQQKRQRGGGGDGGESDEEMEEDGDEREVMAVDDDEEEDEEVVEKKGLQRQVPPKPAAARSESAPERFRCRDGEFAEDDKLGRQYRAEAKSLSKKISNEADAKAAHRAFKLWDDMAINAWDRRRWINPSKDQEDTPELLGQLNRLFDLAERHGHTLHFPFPQRVRGGGLEAFVAPAGEQDQAREAVVVVVERPQKKSQKEKKEKERKEERGPRRRGGSRMVDDGGRGRGSDAEEEEEDGFMVPDGRGETTSEDESEREEERKEENEQEPDVINLAGTESQSLVLAPAGGGGGAGAPHHRHFLLESSSDEEEEAAAAAAGEGEAPVQQQQRRRSSVGGEAAAELRRQRELARLSAWHWDTRKEEHPPNAEVFGLVAEGKRSRRPRFSASQLVAAAALGGSEEQTAAVAVEASMPADTPENQNLIQESDPESDDDDVPLAAQFGRSGGAGQISVTPPAPVAPVPVAEEAEDGDVPATEVQPVAITPAAVSSAERAAAAARALLGSLYASGGDGTQPQQQEASPAVHPEAQPSPQLPVLGVIPDSQGDDFDFEIDIE